MTHRTLAIVASAFAALAVAALACGDPSHTYLGRGYAEARDCLEPTRALDVVEGEVPGACDPKCLVQPLSDGGRALYVGTMCGPYPFGFDLSGADPACPAALAAQARKDICLSDGGSSSPAPRDAAAD